MSARRARPRQVPAEQVARDDAGQVPVGAAADAYEAGRHRRPSVRVGVDRLDVPAERREDVRSGARRGIRRGVGGPGLAREHEPVAAR